MTTQTNDTEGAQFQQSVRQWMKACFGPVISADKTERNHRFLEEALELVQSGGCTASEAHQLVDYVFGRPVGELGQEVGGTMVTLAALCLAQHVDMHAEAERELARINVPETVAKIRAKQAAKPKHSPLPAAPAAVAGPANDLEELAMLNKLIELGAKASYANAQSNSDDGRAGAEADDRWRKLRSEMGELIRAHKAPALEAPPGVAGRTVPRNDDERAAAQFFADNPGAALLAWPLYLARDKSPALEAPAAPELAAALDRMDALLDPKNKLLAVGDHSATAEASRADMALIRAALAAAPQAPAAPSIAVVTDEQIDAILDSPGGLGMVIADKRERMRMFARRVLDLAAPAAPAVDAPAKVLSQAARDVLAERRRQVEVEGWTPEHDDEHSNGAMSIAAACYALAGLPGGRPYEFHSDRLWMYTGWGSSWFKRGDRRRNLVKAAALNIAELERLDRLAAKASS